MRNNRRNNRRNNNNNNRRAVVPTNTSSMAVRRNRAALNNPTVRGRMGLIAVDGLVNSAQVLSQSQSPGPVGSQYTASTLVFRAQDLSPNFQNWIQEHDAYRICQVEIYALLTSEFARGTENPSSIPVVHYCYEDMDTGPEVTTSWVRVRDRNNLSRTVLRANQPESLVAKIIPRPSFEATGDQNPGNQIGARGVWLDSLNLSQVYTGLRAFSYCPAKDDSGRSYSYTLTYTARIKVECKAPI